MVRETSTMPRQLPSSVSVAVLDLAAKEQETLTAGALVLTRKLPLPVHLPPIDRRKAGSAALVGCANSKVTNAAVKQKRIGIVLFP